MDGDHRRPRADLKAIARRAMINRGLLPDFSDAVVAEVGEITSPATQTDSGIRDLRGLLWASIDNDDSKDLDQLTVAESQPGKPVRILVAVADVGALVKKSSAIDDHARQNTTTVYTAGKIFSMIPEKLSTDLTSLNDAEDRLAIVIETVIDSMGAIQKADIYRALVRNHAKLAYRTVGAWLEGKGPMPDAVKAVPGLAENLHIQNRVAGTLKVFRHDHGALDLETVEARPVFDGDEIQDLQVDERNRAREIIEDFMIVANGATARFLNREKIPSLRRMVRSPRRWERIVEIAAQYHFELPQGPDSKALAQFLVEQKAADPLRFPDLSLSIIKLLGPGEYVVEVPGETTSGHFGLAVKDYTHSTAPNRRFPDLITQRMLKAILEETPMPYSQEELVELARHCTKKEDDANKVERLVAKSAAAMLLSSRIGDQFDAICTGAADKGTWVRIFHPPVEGRLIRGYEGVDVGNHLKVRLIHTDVEKGFIDFEKVHLDH